MSVAELLNDLIVKLDVSLEKHPIPIWGFKSNKLPAIVGTGFLLRIALQVFFVTASHVLKDSSEAGRFVWDGTNLVPLNMAFYHIEVDHAHGLDFDLAFNELPAELSGVAMHYIPIDISQADSNHVPSKDTQYSFLGYPATQNKIKTATKTLVVNIMPFHCITLMPDQYVACGLNLAVHLAVAFDGPNTKYPDGTVKTPPSPNGISGCGVWSFGELSAIHAGHAQPKLVGVAIAHMKQPERLEATRIAVLLESIRQLFPDTSGAIPTSKFFGISVTVKK